MVHHSPYAILGTKHSTWYTPANLLYGHTCIWSGYCIKVNPIENIISDLTYNMKNAKINTTFPKQRFSQACACGWRRRARLVRGVLQNCRGICTPSKDHHHQHENCWCVSCHHHACWSHPSDIPLFFILSVQEREAELAMKTILVWQELQVMNAYMTFPESDSRFIVIILTGFYMTILITWKNLDAGSVHWVGTQVADRCDEASGA